MRWATRGGAGLLMLGLAACGTLPRQAPAPASVPPPAAPSALPAPPAAPKPVPPVEPEPAAERSPWQRIRDGLAMPGCDHGADAMRWAHRYAASPRRFEASWVPAMPLLLWVLDEVERRKLPTEFVFLPYVESHYRPLPGRSGQPAGMWQLTATTARGQGLHVGADYDGRLDLVESTRASLDLIALYEEKFADWRLANMAFNAGEFRVRRLIEPLGDKRLSPGELARLALSRTTHEHLDKLMALACIASDPARFGVRLPEPRAADRLQTVTLPRPIDLRVAAHLAGIDVDTLRRLNAGHLRTRIAADAPLRLVLPAPQAQRFTAASADPADTLWSDWRELRTRHATDVAALASAAGVDAHLVGLANGLAADARIADGARVLLPGREQAAPAADQAKAAIHVVKSGDTLGAIARRYRVKLAQLLRWNALSASATLRPGDRIRVTAPRDR
ncbi:MAG TPA: LysM peptidoglycan-binding domain-containing protein [Dokdonella sp.]|uniref:LysM peptidoglycan-binding domain-containing protein n=1 Tax=Dokdonella sp. TaxID=2291710 RepID=UPI002C53074B|nr:LysM peptidoglycan-binding domain-containing protein [Dokdonella sp.]HUD42114.1 LysM peptidoglycan-binding domain-containing protein [Dokdonella sp.]